MKRSNQKTINEFFQSKTSRTWVEDKEDNDQGISEGGQSSDEDSQQEEHEYNATTNTIMTTASNERIFSSLKYVKNYLRSNMGEGCYFWKFSADFTVHSFVDKRI